MPTITLHLNSNKQLDGISERDQKAYAKFKHRIANLGEESIAFSYNSPRSGPYHRRFFVQINALFEAQEQFQDDEMFRKWLTVGAGYAEFCPSSTGKMCAIPKSIAYDKLDQQEFQDIHDKIFEFARSEHARQFLYPHLSDGVSLNMINAILMEFETER